MKPRLDTLNDLCVVLLAGGKGSRLRTEQDATAKGLRKVCGRPMIYYVLDQLCFLQANQISIITGYQAEAMQAAVLDYASQRTYTSNEVSIPAAKSRVDHFTPSFFHENQVNKTCSKKKEKIEGGMKSGTNSSYSFFLQEEQKGTGHAVMMAKSWLYDAYEQGKKDCLVCFCDTPLLKQATLEHLYQLHRKQDNACTFLSFYSSDPLPYGHILRKDDGEFLQILEHRDCNEEQKKIQELYTGIALFKIENLLPALDCLQPNNKQGEYYITDVPLLFRKAGLRIGISLCLEENEGLGINTEEDLRKVEQILQRRNMLKEG